jgi:catechol 2,3-dioxygenase
MATQNQQLQGSIVPMQRAPRPVEAGVTIGHVHLRTADIDRIRAF